MEALPALVDNALTDLDPHVRWRSLWALGRYDDPSPATARLRAALDSREEGVRWNAAVALSVFGSADGLDVLHDGGTSAGTGATESRVIQEHQSRDSFEVILARSSLRCPIATLYSPQERSSDGPGRSH